MLKPLAALPSVYLGSTTPLDTNYIHTMTEKLNALSAPGTLDLTSCSVVEVHEVRHPNRFSITDASLSHFGLVLGSFKTLTETRRRRIIKFPRPQDKYSIFRMERYASLNSCDGFLTDATPAHDLGSVKDPLPSKTTTLPLSITPDTASRNLRTLDLGPLECDSTGDVASTVLFGTDLNCQFSQFV